MDDAARVSVLERPAEVDRDRQRPVDLEPSAGALLERSGQVAAADVLADDVGNAPLLARIEDADDVRVVAELAHRLRLPVRTRQRRLLDPLGVEDRDRDLAISLPGVAGL